jgi:hypothetical protein
MDGGGRRNAHIEGESLESWLADFTPEEIARAEREAEAALDDMGNFVLERDEFGSETLHIDEGEQKLHIERVADVEPVLDWCKAHYSAKVANSHCEFRQLASLPPSVLDIWGRANYPGLPDQWWQLKRYHHLVIKAAHDSDLSGFRTMAGNYIRRGDAA